MTTIRLVIKKRFFSRNIDNNSQQLVQNISINQYEFILSKELMKNWFIIPEMLISILRAKASPDISGREGTKIIVLYENIHRHTKP